MEYLAGGDLLDRILNKIEANNPYTERDAARVMRSIFSALGHLHTEHNMAHRDIKPENILLQVRIVFLLFSVFSFFFPFSLSIVSL